MEQTITTFFKSLLGHLGIFLTIYFLTENQVSNSQNIDTFPEYSTQIKIVEEILEQNNSHINTNILGRYPWKKLGEKTDVEMILL
jgi:hypothetical protein